MPGEYEGYRIRTTHLLCGIFPQKGIEEAAERLREVTREDILKAFPGASVEVETIIDMKNGFPDLETIALDKWGRTDEKVKKVVDEINEKRFDEMAPPESRI